MEICHTGCIHFPDSKVYFFSIELITAFQRNSCKNRQRPQTLQTDKCESMKLGVSLRLHAVTLVDAASSFRMQMKICCKLRRAKSVFLSGGVPDLWAGGSF
ncbi:hypothetical protein L596_012051 [Steinernema carpocapsae]|uniref:Uncharacterized protein n=1 Tax=Steinernema carpocapsae TaxID=34508 RepID=A0A4U5NW90_STECR|nr:hypothetical protein L596_012051 [Steinernema carpocapsae]